MVSNRSRFTSESTSDDDMDYTPNNQQKSGRKPTRTPKCFSKNALIARENRLKKKEYIASLENQASSLKSENKKLSAIVENQSFMISELKKEAKYLRSVISNSGEIGKLIRAINSCTGTPVTSSLAGTTSTSPVTAPLVPDTDNKICIEDIMPKHPWEEKGNTYIGYPTPESTHSYYSSPEFDQLNNDGLLLDLDMPLKMNNDELFDIISEKVPIVDDHTYHSSVKFEEDISVVNSEDVGICLHVSKNKVSLEFCPSCSENALQGLS